MIVFKYPVLELVLVPETGDWIPEPETECFFGRHRWGLVMVEESVSVIGKVKR
jgi:hypothetical protein